jgi:hypothetical protein
LVSVFGSVGVCGLGVRVLVKWGLLFVEDVSAEVLCALAVVELCLVRVAAILGVAEVGLALIEGGVGGGVAVVAVVIVDCVRVECLLGGVESFLVA